MTFTSVHYAEPNGSGPRKKVRFNVRDNSKITPEFEAEFDERADELGELEQENNFEKLREVGQEFWELMKSHSKEERKEFHVDTEVIDLHQEGINAIDLTQMLEFPQLKILVMGYNPIIFLDTRPLEKCPILEELLLDKWTLVDIDLSFVARCPNFRLITLRDDPIVQIDLTPLGKTPNFEVFNMESSHEH